MFAGIYLISLPELYPGWPLSSKLFLIGSFGASAALLYGAPHSPFAQPRHLVMGQLISATVGVTAFSSWDTTKAWRRGSPSRRRS